MAQLSFTRPLDALQSSLQDKKMLSIAIQGHAASFHYQAAENFFPDETLTFKGFDTFSEVFDSLASGDADFAVVAVENSIHGAINETYDLLDKHHFWILSEQYLRIEQCLITLPGTKLKDITDIYTHFAALSQCREFLDKKLPQARRHVHPDTAGAVADIKEWGDPRKAAIASAYAAAHYELPILEQAIETNHHNYTRFALLGRTQRIPANATKTTILVQLQGHSGALYDVLGAFAAEQIDLSMLISRPIVGAPGKYQFYIDLAQSSTAPAFVTAVQAIESTGSQVRLLGSYHPLNTLSNLITK